MTREQFEAHLLDYLYDLLDDMPNEAGVSRADMEAYLRAHPEAQERLTKARSFQQLMAQAARIEASTLEFKPVNTVEPTPTPPTQPGEKRGIVFPRGAFILAASVLLFIAACSSFGLYHYSNLHGEMEQIQAQRDSTTKKLEGIRNQFDALNQQIAQIDQESTLLLEEKARKLQQYENEQLSQQPYIKVIHPESYEAGAPYVMKVQSLNLLHQPLPADLQVRIVDTSRKDAVVPPEKIITQKLNPSEYQVSLPPDLNPRLLPEIVVEVVTQTGKGLSARLSERLKLFSSRYVTHITTDKPMYKPGETVHFRSLTIERFSLKPPTEDLFLEYTLLDGKGEKVLTLSGQDRLKDPKTNQYLQGPDKQPVRGIGANEIKLDPQAPGGEYSLIVSERNQRFPPETRKFIVNRYEHPRIDKELDYTRKSYGPGDIVVAFCKAKIAENQNPLANQPVKVQCLIDGQSFNAKGEPGSDAWTLQTDARGEVLIQLQLPKVMQKGVGTLSVQFTDGANYETLAKPIPIVLNKLYVSLFAEGGDLVADVPNRVYFHVRNNLDHPAELQGRLVDQLGQTVAKLQTLNDDREPGVNQGMGLFEFTPKVGTTYSLQIDKPLGLQPEWSMPEIKSTGLTLQIPQGTGVANQPIHVQLNNHGPARLLLVGVYCRGRLLSQKSLAMTADQSTQIELLPESNKSGVYRVTVFEEMARDGKRHFRPLAERLIYRQSTEKVELSLSTLRKKYVPGEKVMLSVNARDEQQKPVPAILMLAVTDKSILTLADEKTARSMPTHFLLTSELRKPEDLEFMDFMLSSHPKASQALDLLLGTQGWRRFAEQDPEQFRKQLAMDSERMLSQTGLGTPVPIDNYQEVAKHLDKQIQDSLGKLTEPFELKKTSLATKREKLTSDLSELNRTKAGESYQHLNVMLSLLQSKYQALEKAWGKIKYQLFFVLIAGLGLLIGAGLVHLLYRWLQQKQARATYLVLACIAIASAYFILVYGLAQTHLTTDQHNSLVNGAQAMHEPGKMPQMVVPKPGAGPDVNGDPGQRFFATRAMAPPAPMAMGETGGANAPQEKMDIVPKKESPVLVDRLHDGRRNAPEQSKVRVQPSDLKELQKPNTTPESLVSKNPKSTTTALLESKDEQAKKEMKRGQDIGPGNKNQADTRSRILPGNPEPDSGIKGKAKGDEDNNQIMLVKPTLPKGAVVGGGGGGLGGGGRDSLLEQGRAIRGSTTGSNLGMPVHSAEPFIVRVYSHIHPQGMTQVRHDFQETVYWHPVIVLPEEGRDTVTFELGDSVTSYQVTAYAHTLDGRLGTQSLNFQANLPFNVQAKLPVEITASDTLQLPVAVANETEDLQQVKLALTMQQLQLDGPADLHFDLAPQSRVRRLFTLKPSVQEGEATFDIKGSSNAFTDSIRRVIPIVPDGFPIVENRSGELDQIVSHELLLPKDWIKGTLKLQASVYPSILADLQTGLESILREPHGCFEQTSSSNYPNTMILNYMRETKQLNPELEQRIRSMMERGYQKLISFECEKDQTKREGYDWFGGRVAPHEALTAYGLMQFRDMAAVYPVDPAMLKRTEAFLLESRDGQGGFKRNPKALDRFGRAPSHITNAYIVWSLTEGGTDTDLHREISQLKDQSKTSRDPYFLALVANSLLNLKQHADAQLLLEQLAQLQAKEGYLQAIETSITGSHGRDLQIETTALAILAWLKSERLVAYHPQLKLAIHWLSQQRSGHGGFGSTQSTVLALKALLTFARNQNKMLHAGQWTIAVNGTDVASMNFTEKQQETMTLLVASAEKYLKDGLNRVRITMTGENKLPYSLYWTYQTLTPASSEGCAVQLSTELKHRQLNEGETVRLSITVKNVSGKGQGMAVAIIGLPAGLTLPEDFKQLKDHARLRDDDTKPGLISAWEIRGRELILYWRDLAPDAVIEVPIDLNASIPGTYRGPASRAYLYYSADTKHWVEPISVDIKAQK